MQKASKYRFSIKGKPLYPHIKITRERFPRVLATRVIEDDDAEYFGAFLNRTNARILIDFLNRTFRLRSCEIDIDGSFSYPCTMYYKNRCLAPCVSDLMSEADYLEMVALIRLFLLNDREAFVSALVAKIGKDSEKLHFESAAKWRDLLSKVDEYWSNPRTSPWLEETSDTITYRLTGAGGLDVVLISQKGRRVLGERIFSFADSDEEDVGRAISQIIEQFYLFHLPKEIRVPIQLSNKAELETLLLERVCRRASIVLLNEKNQKVSTNLAVYKSTAELDVQRSIPRVSVSGLMGLIRGDFKLSHRPSRITAVDVSHISGTDPVAAAISWTTRATDRLDPSFWLSDASGEIESIRRFIAKLASSRTDAGIELFLVDGGPAQLSAALSVDLPDGVIAVSAVKPAGEHGSIAAFLTDRGGRVDFDMDNGAHRFLQRLRDDAHEFANAVHRDVRDFANYYKLTEVLPSLTESERRTALRTFGSVAGVFRASETEIRSLFKNERAAIAIDDIRRYRSGRAAKITPLVVPTRLQAENGAAEDLRPIESYKKTGRN